MNFEISATAVVPTSPDAVFDQITDIDRLPEWNREIRTVHERPQALVAGAQWVVEIHALGTHWASRSTVVDIDRERGLFAYRSQTDDGNPGYADWRWEVTPHPDGALVCVRLSARPRTFWRRFLLSELRRRSLPNAVRRSLDNLTNERTPA